MRISGPLQEYFVGALLPRRNYESSLEILDLEPHPCINHKDYSREHK